MTSLFLLFEMIFYSTLQSISFKPLLFKKLFVLENGLLPKNPLYAENGDDVLTQLHNE